MTQMEHIHAQVQSMPRSKKVNTGLERSPDYDVDGLTTGSAGTRGVTALALEIQRGSKLQQDNQPLSKMNQNVFGNRNASQANSSTAEANLISQMYP